MQEIIRETQAMLAAGETFGLVTLIGDEGSTPRAAGAEMLVRSDGSIAGTVGGGLLEATAIHAARAALETRRSSLVTVELKGRSVEDREMLCGGRARLLVSFVPAADPELAHVCSALVEALQSGRTVRYVTAFRCVDPEGTCRVAHSLLADDRVVAGAPVDGAQLAKLFAEGDAVSREEPPDGSELYVESISPPPVVVICGAGHVGQALAPAAAAVGFDVVVIDDRPEFASPLRFPPGTRLIVPPDLDHAFASFELEERSYVVIATRGHAYDFRLLERALRSPAAYIGLMASTRKRQRFSEALLERGFSAQDLERIHSPVGLAIEAETPAELAVSIVAELVMVKAQLRR